MKLPQMANRSLQWFFVSAHAVRGLLDDEVASNAAHSSGWHPEPLVWGDERHTVPRCGAHLHDFGSVVASRQKVPGPRIHPALVGCEAWLGPSSQWPNGPSSRLNTNLPLLGRRWEVGRPHLWSDSVSVALLPQPNVVLTIDALRSAHASPPVEGQQGCVATLP